MMLITRSSAWNLRQNWVVTACSKSATATTMPMMNSTIEALKQAEVRARVGVMIGGAPVNQAYADQVGADGYAPDSATAVEVADALMEKRAAS